MKSKNINKLKKEGWDSSKSNWGNEPWNESVPFSENYEDVLEYLESILINKNLIPDAPYDKIKDINKFDIEIENIFNDLYDKEYKIKYNEVSDEYKKIVDKLDLSLSFNKNQKIIHTALLKNLCDKYYMNFVDVYKNNIVSNENKNSRINMITKIQDLKKQKMNEAIEGNLIVKRVKLRDNDSEVFTSDVKVHVLTYDVVYKINEEFTVDGVLLEFVEIKNVQVVTDNGDLVISDIEVNFNKNIGEDKQAGFYIKDIFIEVEMNKISFDVFKI